MPNQVISLPDWAAFKKNEKGSPFMNDRSYVVVVDTHAAYPAILAEYREMYDREIPGEMRGSDGKVSALWAECLKGLDPENPDSYWCEVAKRTVTLDLQISARTFALNINMKDPGKKYRQEQHTPAIDKKTGQIVYEWKGKGRDPRFAAGGGGPGSPVGKEAREHYKRLRGFLPA